jgi:hypothetical protein
MKLTRKQAIQDIIEHELDAIWESGAEKCVADMLRVGVLGYESLSDGEIRDTYYDIFDEELKLIKEITCNDCSKCGENICGNDTENLKCFEKK